MEVFVNGKRDICFELKLRLERNPTWEEVEAEERRFGLQSLTQSYLDDSVRDLQTAALAELYRRYGIDYETYLGVVTGELKVMRWYDQSFTRRNVHRCIGAIVPGELQHVLNSNVQNGLTTTECLRRFIDARVVCEPSELSV